MAGCESLRELHERAAQQHSRAEAAASAALAATDRGHAAFYASALRAIGEMASQLERTLNTVLAEAMTRDLVHGAYNAEMEAVALGDLLASAHDADSADRFAINLSPNPFPVLELDPRVLFHIYRNVRRRAAVRTLRPAVSARPTPHQPCALTHCPSPSFEPAAPASRCAPCAARLPACRPSRTRASTAGRTG